MHALRQLQVSEYCRFGNVWWICLLLLMLFCDHQPVSMVRYKMYEQGQQFSTI